MQNISDDTSINDNNSNSTNPTISGIAKHFAYQDGEIHDKKQYTYQIMCFTFLLQPLNETQDPTSPLHKQMHIVLSTSANSTLITNLRDQFIA